jgi:beta-galactosidase
MKILCRWFVCILVSIFFASAVAAEDSAPREKLLFDFNWKFHLGNEWGAANSLAKAGQGSGPASRSFSDASWRMVNLPHDWAVELPFDQGSDGSHGFHPVGPGFAANNVAWYRRTFELPPEDSGKRLWLEFDGVFRDAQVFVNGWLVGHHESGYSGFRYDITDVANCGGKNVVAVKVDASQFEGWFYEGAGIYRHVWLEKTAPVAIAPDGIFVRSKFWNSNNVSEGPVEIQASAEIINFQTNAINETVFFEIHDPSGEKIGGGWAAPDPIPSNSKKEINFSYLLLPSKASPPLESWSTTAIAKHDPIMWSPESPKLYKLITTVELDGKIVDRKETEFGIRTVAFDAEKGFLLNGQPYEIKGTCNHQDMAGVGAALPDALQYFRIAKLKEMGDNAYRTSHNPPTPELLEACDRLGMLVMDECRLLGSDEENLRRWEDQIRRDRNHASVAIWSICNEEGTQTQPVGARVGTTMQNLVKRLDPTRPVTAAESVGDVFTGLPGALEVRGWNYHVGDDMDNYHAEHPSQPEVGTEQGSTVSTRGIYANDKVRGYVSAYDVNAPSWAHTAEHWWSYFDDRPWLSGGFVWTGFDYRGEPTPYSWPCINSHFGILDVCGFPKDNFYYYQSVWTDKPMVHLLPHWNWPGKEGQDIDMWAYSNCKEVELFLNGQSLGKQAMPKNSHLEWMVKYAPGVVSAKGYDAEGKVIAETKVETTGDPATVQLMPDRSTINADGEDVSVITVSIADAQGRIIPVASNSVSFKLDGPGKIIGVGNGDPSSHEPDQFIPQSPMRSVPFNDGWRFKKLPSVSSGKIAELRTNYDDSAWDVANVQADGGQLSEQENAVFRAKINVTAEDLAAHAIELRFGSIDEDGRIYVNGRNVGESQDWQVPAVVDIKSSLHPGENMIAVAVQNWNGPGGLDKGVSLQFANEPIAPEWKRSTFNGLAQVLVQSTKEPGEIKLTARADGLMPAILKLNVQPATPRPAVAAE